MERGLRKRDPFSPFLFLLVAEALQISIIEACNKGFFWGVSLANNGANVSLLQYANDALIFGYWFRLNAKYLILTLKFFKEALGLKVNISKSRLFGVGVPISDVKVFASAFVYLGLPVGKSMQGIDGWNEVVNMFRLKLSAWKANVFSIGERLTLVKPIFRSLPKYYLSLFKSLNTFSRLLSPFDVTYFGVLNNLIMASTGKWNRMLLVYSKGDLGIGSSCSKILALLGKWKWRFLTEKGALGLTEKGDLWRNVISCFYGDDGGFGSSSSLTSFKGGWSDIL
ncbi:reverse transcriptase domain, reverse transcriptase zinc-binding domain protein [Tanacetum coccineum]